MKLALYTVHHLNLCFSSVEEEQRAKVVEKCYWPLLRLAEALQVPVGIEAPAYTLESITNIDSSWTEKLKELCGKGLVEFIGSGYSQVIAPLVPPEVNLANLLCGNEVYRNLLGFKPEIALINEQAYSAGLIQHYIDTGFKAIVMEWENPASHHPEWSREWRYYPQYACAPQGEKIALIWNKSIAFQKFQRYAHRDMEMTELIDYLAGHVSENPRCFPLYGNDIEVFDFRPGRFETEAILHADSEWTRISRLYEALVGDKRFDFIKPSQVLNYMTMAQAGHDLHLESPDQPIPVKKQGKYNITRWAITGRDDIGLNTLCWRMYKALAQREPTDLPSKIVQAQDRKINEDWKRLCYFWSSDFRTHITQKRWEGFQQKLFEFRDALGLSPQATVNKEKGTLRAIQPQEEQKVLRDGRFLSITTDTVKVRLNCNKGLAIDKLWLGNSAEPFLCGTLEHGYFDDISLGADWFTGHTVFEIIGQPKVTDLMPVKPTIKIDDTTGDILINGTVKTSLGEISKSIYIYNGRPEIEILFDLDWTNMPVGSLRLGTITLNPEAFVKENLYFQACNGGSLETFPTGGHEIDHGKAVSFLVSAQSGLGITDGRVIIGDGKRRIIAETDKDLTSLLALVRYHETSNSYLFRLSFSAGEMDETRRLYQQGPRKLQCKIRLKAD
jgi:hypothetical protein